jgi:hypothetical protein
MNPQDRRGLRSAVRYGLPHGLSTADNEVGWRMSLAKLAALVEASPEI